MRHQNNTAFTLIEVMVVVIIIGILVSMSVPIFTKTMESAREKEARTTLELIYNAEKIYRLDKKIYASSFNYMTSYLNDPNTTADYYDYNLTSSDPNTSFAVTATRGSKVLSIDQTGTITE